MDISGKRLLNAKLILKELCAGNKSAFARKIEKTPQLLNKWWSDDDAMKRNIGNSSARLIERSFELPHGWLDELHDNINDLEEDPIKKAELKAASGDAHVIPVRGNAMLDHKYQLSIINNNIGKLMLLSTDSDAYAFQLIGHNTTQILDNNWGLAVEPNTPLTLNEYALVRLKGGEVLLRLVIYIDEESIVFRHPLNDEQLRIERSQIDRAEYCYVGIPPSKIKLDPPAK